MMTVESMAIQLKTVFDLQEHDIVVLERMLREYEKSKWIKFNHNDESTWPKYGEYLVASTEGIITASFHE